MAQKIKLIALLKARPGMSRKEFEKRWVERHAPFTLKMPRLKGYRMNVAIEEFQEIQGELPYDGTAELWWDSLEDMKADFASREGKAAGADADSFCSVRIHIITREHITK
jgi:uncharacterized protein (TIGR02118 family)